MNAAEWLKMIAGLVLKLGTTGLAVVGLLALKWTLEALHETVWDKDPVPNQAYLNRKNGGALVFTLIWWLVVAIALSGLVFLWL